MGRTAISPPRFRGQIEEEEKAARAALLYP